MASHAAGSRFISLMGGAMLSFYDWYCDLPVASPQVFGDQTDVPESADWWNASYLIMWGANVPVTRTPDAHFMTEARYRGQKVVTVSPDYADNTKFADEWLTPHPGTDGALGMAMGHVILKEFYIERQVPRFVDYVKKYSDLPFLITVKQKDGAYVPDKFLTAADLGDDDWRARRSRPSWSTPRPAAPPCPTDPWDSATPKRARASGTWTSAGIDPALSLHDAGGSRNIEVLAPRFDVGHEDNEGGGVHTRGVPVVPVSTTGGERLVTTVFDLMLAQYGVGRDGLPGDWPTGYDDPAPVHPGLAGGDHRSPRRTGHPHRPGVRAERRGLRRPVDDHPGCRHQPLVPFRHHLPDLPRDDHTHRLPGRQRRWLGALRRPGEVPAGDRVGQPGVRISTGSDRPGR